MKTVYTSHGLPFCRYSSKKQWFLYFGLEKIAARFTDTIITINEEDRKNAGKLGCKDVRRINGVGVDTAYYHDVEIDVDAYKRKLGLPTDKIMVLSVGELSARKNHQIIIKALGMLPDKSRYIYVICGKEVSQSGFADHLRQLAKECDVALYLLGHRNDIPQIMHCSDIGAIPSLREGLGLAGVQSLCANVPLVGTDVQGIREYIFDGISGYLCSPYDAQGYADAIQKLSDPKLRDRMKQNCYEIAKRFDIAVSHEQMREIYQSILSERGSYE
jgi:glycosyltransferase involved in cell wall biosynthesis